MREREYSGNEISAWSSAKRWRKSMSDKDKDIDRLTHAEQAVFRYYMEMLGTVFL